MLSDRTTIRAERVRRRVRIRLAFLQISHEARQLNYGMKLPPNERG
jgi:hypothetical protein